MAKDPKNQPRPRRKIKSRSGGAIAASVGGGGIVGAGATLLIQYLTDVDDRVVSGVATGLGAVAAAAGHFTKSPTVRDVGIGLGLAGGAILASDVVAAVGEDPKQLAARNADGGAKTIEAIRQELKQAAPAPAAPAAAPASQVDNVLRMQRA